MKPFFRKIASATAGAVALLLVGAMAGLGLTVIALLAMFALAAVGLAFLASPFLAYAAQDAEAEDLDAAQEAGAVG